MPLSSSNGRTLSEVDTAGFSAPTFHGALLPSSCVLIERTLHQIEQGAAPSPQVVDTTNIEIAETHQSAL